MKKLLLVCALLVNSTGVFAEATGCRVLTHTYWIENPSDTDSTLTAKKFHQELSERGFTVVENEYAPADAYVGAWPQGEAKQVVVKKSENPYQPDLTRNIYSLKGFVKVGNQRTRWVDLDVDVIVKNLKSMGCNPNASAR